MLKSNIRGFHIPVFLCYYIYMIIGINASAALKQPRTGVEEYCYQVIKHLTMLPEARAHRFFLYISKSDPNDPNFHPNYPNKIFDFEVPKNFKIKELFWPFPMWTQLRLASEMLFNKPDTLFIPVHILPRFHPKNSVVTIHGLEYEYFPEYYPFWFRNYLRFSTKYAVRYARKIIAVSENTKRDLVKLYGAQESGVEVIHHGVEIQNVNIKMRNNPLRQSSSEASNVKFKIEKPYLFYVGRIELKKNIFGILEAYRILKEKYKIPHELVLAGVPGFGYEKIKPIIHDSKFIIHELGYISEGEKQQLLANADIFLFPSFYEGFGLPILEAQASGVPVVSSNVSSVPEIAGNSALLVDPKNPEQIAQAVYKIIDDKALRDKLIELGFENVKRFSWEKCAKETLKILLE